LWKTGMSQGTPVGCCTNLQRQEGWQVREVCLGPRQGKTNILNMENPISINKNENGEGAVSARELHAFLESKREFAHWIRDRIEKYGLVEGQDFTSHDEIVMREIGATRRIEYALTIECAKELAMVEGNEKGRQARRYFIECEKKLRGISAQQIGNADTVIKALEIFNHGFRTATLLGKSPWTSASDANSLAARATGVDVLANMGMGENGDGAPRSPRRMLH